MYIAVSRNLRFDVDSYCQDARTAKRLLRENSISRMAIGYRLNGRENGVDLLSWAAYKALLPPHIYLCENNPTQRKYLVDALLRLKYKTGDNIRFIKDM